MQGKTETNRQMLDAAVFCRGLVGDGTIYAFLADHRNELFKEEDFADLFPTGRGRPSIPRYNQNLWIAHLSKGAAYLPS